MFKNNGKSAIWRNFLFFICIVCVMLTSFGFLMENSYALELNETGIESNSDDMLENSQINEVLEADLENDGDILGAERTVSGNTFDSIQKAVNDAKSGDTIKLSGTYHATKKENQIVVDKKLTFAGSPNTVLDGKKLSYMIQLKSGSAGTVIKDIKFINGNYAQPSAISVYDKNIKIENCVFENNHCSSGGAIFTKRDLDTAQNLKITNCTFRGNNAYKDNLKETTYGSAASVFGRGSEIRNCIFDSNWVKSDVSSWGGAIQAGIDQPGSNVKVIDCIFINNVAYSGTSSSHGGAGCVREGTSYIGCKFINNTADQGGALTFHASGSLVNCTFIGNKASNYGGAVSTGFLYENYMEFTMLNCIFDSNTAPLGGAIQAMGLNIDIVECSFKNNNASQYGGGINVEAENVNIKNSDFNSNIAHVDGGAVYIKGKNTFVENSSFFSNEAIPDVTKLDDGLGGAIYISSSQARVYNNDFMYNVARNGSAIYYDELGEKLTVENNTFFQNQAWSYLLPIHARDIYYGDAENIRVILYGGNNIADFDNVAVSNAIYNAAGSNSISVNNEFPVLGATDSGHIYQDSREYNMNILLTVQDEDGRLIYNGVGNTNYLGEISVDLENLNPGKYYVSAKHYEDTYYKAIANETTFTVYPKVDNMITISTTDSSFNFDDVVVWTLNVSNNGPNNATGVFVTNILPEGLNWISDSSNGRYNPKNGTLTIGDLNVGENLSFTIVTVVDKTGEITNRANITSNEEDINMTNNLDEKTIFIPPASDLKVTKSPSDNSPNYHGYVNWTISVSNNGPDDAHNVTVFDLLSKSLIYVGSDGDYDADSGIWHIGTLKKDEKVQLIVRCFVNSTGLIRNDVSVNGSEYDYDLSNNNDSKRIYVNPACDLAIVNTANGTQFNFGDLVRWTLEITNNGPDNASQLSIEDILPEGFIYLNSTLDFTDGAFSVEKLGVGEKIIIDIMTRVNVTGECLSIANVSSDEYDYDLSNNKDNETVFVNPASDLLVEKTVDESEPMYGDSIIWTVTVTNNGPDDADGVILSDLLPDSLIWFDDDGEGSYNPITGNWKIGQLRNGESVSLDIECIVDATGEIQNIASVSSKNYDPDPSNNRANETISVEKSADVSITKLVNESEPNYGDLVKWTLIISNSGPDKATDISIEEIMPEGLTVINHSATKGIIVGSRWVMCCLEKDEVQYLEIVCRVNKTGRLTNIAIISAEEYDSNESNNIANESIDVPLAIDLEVSIEADNAEALFGDNITWMIAVRNNGPDNGTDVVLQDIIPEGLEIISHNTLRGQYSDDEWNIGTLNVGEVVFLNITTISNSLGGKTVGVEVDGREYDWNRSNNRDDSTVNIRPVADLSITKSVDNPTPNYGDIIRWTLIAVNNGPNDATNVVVYDELPYGLNFITSNGNYENGIWTIGFMEAGQSAQLEITCEVGSTGKFVNTADIASDDFDPDSGNNHDEEAIDVPPASDLSITKIASKYRYYVGDVIEYVIEVVNNGPDAAHNIKVREKFPNSLKLKSFKPSKGRYDKFTHTWSIDSLDFGESAILYIKAIAAGDGIVRNEVTVTSDNFDPNPDDNSDFAVVNISKRPDESDNSSNGKKAADLNENHESILEKHPTANPVMVLVISLIGSLVFLGNSISNRK